MRDTSSRARSRLARIQLVLAGVIAVTIVLMAALAGRWWFLGEAVIELHGYIGNAVFVLALVNLALAFRMDSSDGPALAVAGLIVLLVFAQIGLGYVGRETQDAAAIHVPNGVLLMGLSAYQFADLRLRARYSHEAAA
jgi:hypothetical protein